MNELNLEEILREVQEIKLALEELENRKNALEAENAELKKIIEEYEYKIASLEAKVASDSSYAAIPQNVGPSNETVFNKPLGEIARVESDPEKNTLFNKVLKIATEM